MINIWWTGSQRGEGWLQAILAGRKSDFIKCNKIARVQLQHWILLIRLYKPYQKCPNNDTALKEVTIYCIMLWFYLLFQEAKSLFLLENITHSSYYVIYNNFLFLSCFQCFVETRWRSYNSLLIYNLFVAIIQKYN